MSLLRVVITMTVVHVVGVIIGFLFALNLLRLSEKHIDRGQALTNWSRSQIIIGHFFMQNGYFLFILSSSIVVGFWIIFMVRSSSKQRPREQRS